MYRININIIHEEIYRCFAPLVSLDLTYHLLVGYRGNYFMRARRI